MKAGAPAVARRCVQFDPAWLRARLEALCGPLAGQRLCIAYSGGVDSTALLHALVQLRRTLRFALRAVHVNHQLQEVAGEWARLAVARARSWQVRIDVRVVQVAQTRGASLEATARDARYAALAAALGDDEFLLTAHNEDDQLETVLLQLLRGAGLPGLAAMPVSAPFAGGMLLRPLLGVSRELLRQYLERSGVPWIEDPSNADECFDRNYLRRRVVPVLRARWPSVGLTASRSARHAAEAQALLGSAAEGLLDAALDGETLKLTVLRRLTMTERRLALRQWIVQRGYPLPEERRLDEIAGRLVHARADAQPLLRWQGCELRCHAGRLHVAPVRAEPVRESLEWWWSRQRRIRLPGGGSLALVAERFGDIATDRLPPDLWIRFREGGERLGERFGRRTLKALLQQHHLPPWQRAQLPLVGNRDAVLAIPGLWVAPALRATATDKRRARLRWLPVDKNQRVATHRRQRWHPPP